MMLLVSDDHGNGLNDVLLDNHALTPHPEVRRTKRRRRKRRRR